jgi:hypothetical protein
MVAFAYDNRMRDYEHMTRKQIGPTVIQDIALNLVFSVMGERRINRAQQEYADIAAKLPPLKVLSFKVNQLLQSIHQESARSEIPLPQLCRFKAGDQRWNYEDYPQKISRETMRIALEVSGMRRPRGKRTKSL